MVRLKERYLLVQILYPTLPASIIASSTSHGSTASRSNAASGLLSPRTPSTPALLALYSPTPDSVNPGTLLRILRHHITTLFGEPGAATTSAGLKIMYWSNATSSFVVRCRRDVVRMVWAAVTFVTSLAVHDERGVGRGGGGAKEKERDCVWGVVHVSGTMRKCEEEAVNRARGMLGRAKGLRAIEDAGVDVERLMGVDRGAMDGDEDIDGQDMVLDGAEDNG